MGELSRLDWRIHFAQIGGLNCYFTVPSKCACYGKLFRRSAFSNRRRSYLAMRSCRFCRHTVLTVLFINGTPGVVCIGNQVTLVMSITLQTPLAILRRLQWITITAFQCLAPHSLVASFREPVVQCHPHMTLSRPQILELSPFSNSILLPQGTRQLSGCTE